MVSLAFQKRLETLFRSAQHVPQLALHLRELPPTAAGRLEFGQLAAESTGKFRITAQVDRALPARGAKPQSVIHPSATPLGDNRALAAEHVELLVRQPQVREATWS